MEYGGAVESVAPFFWEGYFWSAAALRSRISGRRVSGYKISRKCVFLGGYRYLSVNYRPNGKAQFVHDVNMPGLMFGVTINFKWM